MEVVLVTGGAGYVGAGLLRVLLKQGYKVVCLDKLMFGGESLLDIWHDANFAFESCDINDHDHLDRILKKYKFSAVIHLAAIVGDPACRLHAELAKQTNWDSSVRLLQRSVELGIPRFAFASTCSNYGRMTDPNDQVSEESPLAPVSLYAELKVKFENLLLKEIDKRDDFCPTSLRFATVYGVSHRMRFDLTVNEFTKELALGRELVVFGEQFWRPYCHVRDFSRAFATILRAPYDKVAYNVFNVGDTKENYTKQMIIEEIRKVIPDARVKYVEKSEDPRDYRVNSDKIKRELGFEISMTVPDGIREIKEVVRRGIIRDPEDQRYYNIPYAGLGRTDLQLEAPSIPASRIGIG
jgi:nucleoside-diphosphate-sugar epimerase